MDGGRQYIERLAMESEDFAVHHDIHRSVEVKIDAHGLAWFRQGMVNVGTVIKRRQVANQPNPANRPPTDEFDQSIVHFRAGSNHHGPAGKFAVAEGQKQAGAAINLLPAIDLQGERPTPETRQANKNGGLVAKLSPAVKPASTQRCHVGGKSHAQQIDVMDDSIAVPQAQYIAGLRLAIQQGIECILYALVAEVAQEGIPCAQRKKRQSG